jgi:CRISP-associated protein Cas1
VVCYGRVGLSTPFLREAAQRGIEIVLLDENGTDGGRLTPLTASDPTARRAQYRAADDPGQCRTLAAAFVTGKVSNMRVTLLRTAGAKTTSTPPRLLSGWRRPSTPSARILS